MRKVGFLKHVLSYIWDFHVESFFSELNGQLEVKYQHGRYILNSKNANYSFEQLHKVFKTGFSHIERSYVPMTVLNLGMGAGSTLAIIRNDKKWQSEITSVEYDPVIVEIATKYFELDTHRKHRVILEDALHFVRECKERYDLIIIDLFKDRIVEERFKSIDFFLCLSKILSPDGKVLANFISEDQRTENELSDLIIELERVFKNIEVLNIHGINRLLIIDK